MKLADKIFKTSVDLALKAERMAAEGTLPHHSVGTEGSPVRSLRIKYQFRLCMRILVCTVVVIFYFIAPEVFESAERMNFFRKPTFLHLLWLYWLIETILPSFATRGMISVGSLKYAQRVYIPGGKIKPDKLFAYAKRSTKDSLKVFLVWAVYMLCLFVGDMLGLLGTNEMIVICAILNVLDVIFVLSWCPFRTLLMKNRCCTTCRIFNWDHILIYSALFFVPGFFGATILLFSVIEFLVWEICFFLHPERFWEGSNSSLRCSNCTDKICTHTFLK